MRPSIRPGILVFAFAMLMPAASYAQQSVNFSIGGFVPRGEDGRSSDDVLVNNLDFLAFNIDDFSTLALNGEWEFPLNDMFHASLGIGLTTKSVPSVYSEFEEDDGTLIEQDLKLRIVPFTAAIRLLPLGGRGPVQPYIGAGVGIFAWRYSESGEFIDFSTGEVFRESYVGSGATAGPVIFGGIDFPVGSWAIGGEVRYQSAQGELPDDQGFAGTEIDLGGFTYSANFKIRF
jgi:hypothetical protein